MCGRAIVWDATSVDTFTIGDKLVKHAGTQNRNKVKYAEILCTYHFIPVSVDTSAWIV